MNESVSMCMQTSPSERADSHLVAVNEQNIEHVITYLPNAPPDDQKFYQDILVSYFNVSFLNPVLLSGISREATRLYFFKKCSS